MKFGDVLLNFCEWIWRFMILNFLWVIFMVAGGVVLGIMPSTVATFYILRKWVQGNFDIPIFKTFKDVYKKEFINSNKCGFVFFALFAFLAFDLTILYKMEALYSTVLFFVSISFMFFFPLYVHFEQSNKEYIKNSFIIALSSPFQTLLILISLYILSYIVKGNLGLVLFFFMVIPGYLIMHVSNKKFKQIQRSM